MARPSSGENLKVVPLNLNPDDVKEFDKLLPKNKSVSKMVRQFIRDEIDRINAEKKVTGIEASPVKTCYDNSSNKAKNESLDKYFQYWFLNPEDYQTRSKIFDKLTDEQITEVITCLHKHKEAFVGLKRNKELKSKKVNFK